MPGARRTRTARLLVALPPALRGAALMPVAALLVHQLRYELAFGGEASRALAAQGHAYLSSVAPWAMLLATLALGGWLGSLAQRWARGGSGCAAGPGARTGASGARLWLLATIALLGVYAAQELIEGALAPGHAAGLAAVVGGGGWWALPAALLVGGVLTLVLCAGATIAGVLGAERRSLRLTPRAALAEGRGVLPAPAPRAARVAPLALAAAGRAPPRGRRSAALFA